MSALEHLQRVAAGEVQGAPMIHGPVTCILFREEP
jgi:hypothetical protein